MSYIVLPIKTAQMQEAFHSSQALGSAGLKAVEKTLQGRDLPAASGAQSS